RAAQVTTPQTGELDTDSGRVAYAIMPVQIEGQSQTAQLVIVEFLAGEYEEAWATIWTMTGIAVIALIAAGFFGWLVAGRVLAPIRELSETASGIGEDDLTRRIEVKGNDDVAHLGDTFNRMLDRLESAFDGSGSSSTTPVTSCAPRSPSCAGISMSWAMIPRTASTRSNSSAMSSSACPASSTSSSCSPAASGPISSSPPRRTSPTSSSRAS